MPSFEYIESAIIFGLDNKTDLRSFKHVEKDFAKHNDAYRFVLRHFDDYGEFPSPDVLCENFPTLDKTAVSVNFEYATEIFKDQVLQRQIVRTIQAQKEVVKDNPKKALANIMVGLTDIEVVYDEDVQSYDDGTLERLSQWRERTQKRQMGDGIMGIPTSFKSVNSTGVGWMPGELIAMFVHSAATAIYKGFKTLFVSTEMPSASISMRLDVVLANMMGYRLSHKALRHGGSIDEEEYTKFLTESGNQSLLVCDHISGQVGITTEAIAGLVRKHTPEFVVIDGV